MLIHRVSISLLQFSNFQTACCRFLLAPLSNLLTTELTDRLSDFLTAWKLQNISGRRSNNQVGKHSQTCRNFEVSRCWIGYRRALWVNRLRDI